MVLGKQDQKTIANIKKDAHMTYYFVQPVPFTFG